MPLTRLYVSAGLAEGAALTLSEAQTHRLRHVLRLAAGAVVAAFNASDGEWACRIVEIGRNTTRLIAERRLRAAGPEPDLWLLFAPIKRARLDWLIEKATELGVTVFRPVWTARTQNERLNLDRLLAIATAAAEQCERLSVPRVEPAERLDRVMAAWPQERLLLLCDESGGGRPVAEALAGPPPAAAALLIGPEGGFAETELDPLLKLPFVTNIGLGPRVLRAETAALAGLAAFQAIAGDWRQARRR
jgi:16S rRNA (uracil1498-N3)-methyltransferase